MNDTEMNSIEDYNRVVAYNRSYIKMRVLRVDNEIVMVQTPLYDDDFNSLGLLILDNQMQFTVFLQGEEAENEKSIGY